MKMKILVVDDQPELRELMVELMRDAGHDVAVAEDATMAITFLNHNDYDLVVTDNDMPIGGRVKKNEGLRVIEHAHLNPYRPHIVWMTGGAWGDQELIQKARDLGADEIFLKPFEMKKFLTMVQGAAARKTLDVMPV